MKKTIIIVLSSIVAIALILILIVGISLISLNIKTDKINNDISDVYSDASYSESVYVDGIDVIKQEISCGYAVIEMFSKWQGEIVTEDDLYKEYGKVVTSTGKSFEKEMNKRFPKCETTMYKYLTNTELIKKAYDSLKSGVPVPFEWAAKNGNEWTLHYSLLVGMDISSDLVVVLNPYGYVEKLKLGEFISRTNFEAFESMPLFYKLAFGFGIFEKNTIFIVTKKL